MAETIQKLRKNDGTIVTQIVESVRPAARISAKTNADFATGTRILTLESFLSANAVRSTNSLDGVDWCSSNNSTFYRARFHDDRICRRETVAPAAVNRSEPFVLNVG